MTEDIFISEETKKLIREGGWHEDIPSNYAGSFLVRWQDDNLVEIGGWSCPEGFHFLLDFENQIIRVEPILKVIE